ncbi:MAG: F0F1 ATP synthase subunit B [Oscillospiraceae bacterium]|nr:F0F1 ATP synthase subunit B [Oscillospiraceae bacterium]
MTLYESILGVNVWTALFTLANTLLLFFVLKKFLFKPVMKIIDDRQKEIDDLYNSADTAKAEANEMRDEYQKKLEEARETGDKIISDAVTRAQSREEEIVSKANKEASAILEKAQEDIALEKKKAMGEVKDNISVIAVSIAGRVVERELTSADQSRLVDSFIDDLGDLS